MDDGGSPEGRATIAPDLLDSLHALARSTRTNAYAGYSGYRVGAAVQADDGTLHGGCNIENALFGATVCAERVAIWRAVADGASAIRAVVVVTPDGGTPCGFCRQVMWEFAGPELPVAVFDARRPHGQPRIFTLGDLLPHAWTGDGLAG